MGYAELLATRGADERVRRDASAHIRKAAERLSNVIDDLLIVFAADSGKLVVHPVPVDLEHAVRSMIQSLERSHEQHAFEARCDKASWPVVLADEEHVPRVLKTLLLNACRFSPAGGTVQIAVEHENGFAAVSVTGAGPVLTEGEMARAFERFSLPRLVRADATVTGLELYKVRRLVELQGGSVSARPSPRGSSMFSFTLPLTNGRDSGEATADDGLSGRSLAPLP